MKKWTKWVEDKNSSKWWVYPPNCRTKVGARWSPSFPRQSLARRRARNIVQVHAHALNGSWECYHVVSIGLGAIWGDHGRRRSLHFTTPHFLSEKGVGIPTFVHYPFFLLLRGIVFRLLGIHFFCRFFSPSATRLLGFLRTQAYYSCNMI